MEIELLVVPSTPPTPTAAADASCAVCGGDSSCEFPDQPDPPMELGDSLCNISNPGPSISLEC